MYIVFVSPEFHPFINVTGRGEDTARLADEFVAAGHGLCAVIPFPSGKNLEAYSLARRLVPISVEVDGKQVKATRYDGRTSSGVEVHLLEFEGFEAQSKGQGWTPEQIEAFGKASALLIESLQGKIDVCISWDREASCVPAILDGAGEKEKRPAHVLVVTDPKDPGTQLKRGIGAADRVIFADSLVEEEIRKHGFEALDRLFDRGFALSLKRPSIIPGPPEAEDKVSLKSEFQLKHDLPVREDVPLVCFPKPLENPFSRAIKELLKRDVQVVAHRTGGDFTYLGERYTDRLVLVEGDVIESEAIAASDACVVGNDIDLAAKALQSCTLPIAGPLASANLVELEQSCQSGSGVLMDEVSYEALVDAFGRLHSAFIRGDDFYGLLSRLPRYVPTWQGVAGHYLQVVESIVG